MACLESICFVVVFAYLSVNTLRVYIIQMGLIS